MSSEQRKAGLTFDLSGFYIQPMGIPDGSREVVVNISSVDGEGERLHRTQIAFWVGLDEPYYFEAIDTGEKWDGLSGVYVSAALVGPDGEALDWEVFVDDVWVRWGQGAAAEKLGDGAETFELK